MSDAVISVMLIVDDTPTAVDWYKRALGAQELWNLGGVAGLEVGGAPFLVHADTSSDAREGSPTRSGAVSSRVEVFVDDPHALIDRAAAAGALEVSPVEVHEHAWRHHQGGFRDPFGHRWSVGDRSPLERH